MIFHFSNASIDRTVKAAQALTACITLGYSIQDGVDYNGAYTAPGVANMKDLSCFMPPYYPDASCGADGDVAASQAIAKSCGDTDQDLHCRDFNDISEVLVSGFEEKCFNLRGGSQFAFRFSEYNPKDAHDVYPRFTDRTITASGSCLSYTQTSVDSLPNGESRYTYSNGTFTGSIVIPDYVVAENDTTYIYRDGNPAQSAKEYACGPRCIRLWAYGTIAPNMTAQFYECPITVSNVANATEDVHALSDDVARLMAASIGLTGHTYKNESDWTQFQLYPYGLVSFLSMSLFYSLLLLFSLSLRSSVLSPFLSDLSIYRLQECI